MKYAIKFPSKSIANKFKTKLKTISPKKLQDKILIEIKKLETNPRPHGEPKIKPPIHLYKYVAQYRLRIGDYRVLYDVNDKRKIVWILYLRKRDKRTYR